MIIKKYISTNLSEGKSKIMRELGEEAIILSSREIIDPATGARKVEIVAAIDNQITAPSRKLKSKISPKSTITDNDNRNTDISSPELVNLLTNMQSKLDAIQNEVKYKFASALSDSHANLYRLLINSGLSEKYSLELLAKVSELGFAGSEKDMFFKARQILTENIHISEPLQSTGARKIFFFAGPTGSGKTTTLVKLAVVCSLVLKSNILIVSADNSKVGGADQLETYSSILGIPFKAVDNSANLATLLDNELLRDIIFVDTAGKNPFEEKNINSLKFLIDVADNRKTFLVVNANMALDTMDAVINEYKKVYPTDVIITKIDETKSIGSVLSILHKHNLPLSYITNGQNVPEDIEPVEKELLSKIILPDILLKELKND